MFRARVFLAAREHPSLGYGIPGYNWDITQVNAENQFRDRAGPVIADPLHVAGELVLRTVVVPAKLALDVRYHGRRSSFAQW